jgi:hypothetical protein
MVLVELNPCSATIVFRLKLTHVSPLREPILGMLPLLAAEARAAVAGHHLGPLGALGRVVAVEHLAPEHAPCSDVHRTLDAVQPLHVDLFARKNYQRQNPSVLILPLDSLSRVCDPIKSCLLTSKKTVFLLAYRSRASNLCGNCTKQTFRPT